MKIIKTCYLLIGSLLIGVTGVAQNIISGVVTSVDTGDPIPSVNIIIEGTNQGTTTNLDGRYTLEIKSQLPVTLKYSEVGFTTVRKKITEDMLSGGEVNIQLDPSSSIKEEVVISASRVEENILESPVTVEKLDILDIQEGATPDFYDKLTNVKGVNVIMGSLTFTSINTRGFATNANTRFVQLIDWVDNSAPLLNFPTGNLVGLSELEVEAVELVPGAASALYGPNAFNGIMIMNSKNPFDYQGLSIQEKVGITKQDAAGSNFYNSISLRYAKAFNNKFAFKVHGSFLKAKDWQSNVYDVDKNNPNQRVDVNAENFTGTHPNFDGLNLYGDDIPIQIPINTTFANVIESGDISNLIPIPLSPALRKTLAEGMRKLDNPTVRRTGFREQDLLEDPDAKSIKVGGALHYKFNDNLELIASYTYGNGESLYQGQQKYAIKNFYQQFVKLELKADNFFVRGYTTFTDAGDSYNIDALGGFANEAFSNSATGWVPTYGLTYAAARLGVLGLLDPNFSSQLGTQLDEVTAHQIARAAADRDIPQAGTQAFRDTLNAVRSRYFRKNGASFIDDSRIYHGEFNYNFKNEIDFIDIQVGGNYRQYNLYSSGTVFNEENEEGVLKRIIINEFGVYTQVSRKLFRDKLKLTGSLRYDKNENFDGQVTPRISAVYTFNKKHNIRASYQTGFRNPDTQAQFLFFPTSTGVILGGTRASAEEFNVYERPLINAFDPTQTITVDYVKPEKISVIEIGYKSIINNKLLIDINYYHNSYKNFITNAGVIVPGGLKKNGEVISPNPNIGLLYTNAKDEVTSQGVGFGFQYNAFKNFVFSGNYSWTDFSTPENVSRTLLITFNTPKNTFNLGIANRKVFKNFGFDINYHWQEEFKWVSSFVPEGGYVPSYGLLNGQVNYKIPSQKIIIKLGATNLLQEEYQTSIGGPSVGSQFYLSLTFDQKIR